MLRGSLCLCAFVVSVASPLSPPRHEDTKSHQASYWSNPRQLLLLGIERLAQDDFREAVPLFQTALHLAPDSPLTHAWLAHAFHLQRRLDEAAVHYAEVLKKDRIQTADSLRREAILRHAPRVFQVPTDPFALRDAVAIHHPEEPLIAYHFFWEDDIDFPADNDPCDHELVWVRYDPAGGQLTDFYTYFHGRILSSPAAVRDAAEHSNRPRVNVQWGKHGSLPVGWENLGILATSRDIERDYLDLRRLQTLREYNFATYQKLHKEGRQHADHPRTASWPARFGGSWEEFVRFEREVEILSHLTKGGKLAVSRWNNAALQQNFLAYNFRPKTEWPDRPGMHLSLEAQIDRRLGGAGSESLLLPSEGAGIRKAASVAPDRFLSSLAASPRRVPADLPPMKLFLPETPRYPNIWIYAPVARFRDYDDFLRFVGERFRQAGYSETEVSLNEGADLALSVEHLQPWDAVTGLRHAHSLHLRLFWKRLKEQSLHRADWNTSGSSRGFWRVAGSVHYEVEHAHPLHADVEVCPMCGRTGDYASKAGNLVEVAHDPLGVELVMRGTIRGNPLLPAFGKLFDVPEAGLLLTRPPREDMNTAAILIVKLPGKN
jgi:hypothetical protein